MIKDKLTIGSLIAIGIGTIMGSGWMFSAQYTSEYAGPASIISWIIGALLMIFIALTFAESCTIVPVQGSTSRIPHITHGTLISYIFAWITWISYLVLAPIEVQAVLQYIAVFYPGLIDPQNSGALTMQGIPIAVVLLLVFCAFNFYSLRWLVKINNVITLFKILVPTTIALAFIVFCFSLPELKGRTIESNLEFMPFGINGILSAISLGGIGYAFIGFKAIVELAGNTNNPKKAIPVATLSTIFICLVVFLLLQVAYLLVISKYVHNNVWDLDTISKGYSSSFGAFALLARQFGQVWVMYLLYFGAILFPLIAGLLYFCVALNSLNAMVANGYMPKILNKINPTVNKPVYAIGLNFLVAMIMFAPFPGWKTMAAFLTSLISLTYLTGATSTLAMRYRLPDMERPFRLKAAFLISVLGVFASTLVFLWSGWSIVSKSGFAIFIAIFLLALYRNFGADKSAKIFWNFKESIWFWFYIIAVTVVSYFSEFGGTGALDFYSAALILLLVSFITALLAKYYCLSSAEMKNGIKQALHHQREYLD
ncbi:APC family permease [Allofrancisella frigidaquae]|uniref:APC family permease n=1 Tax=Allofrancisella frigidaquae TaxID=1085644 RepID=A0A6M3HTA1_9GAMM|nr:APC family permease [Allofrancisella frigidaquae]QIV94290.1 APC family permease [Allofrancisella frigidaquae]